MRQEKDDAALPHPLGLPAGDELVNDALRGVGKVTKLSLPEHQGVGVSHGVAQLKACKQASMVQINQWNRHLLTRAVCLVAQSRKQLGIYERTAVFK